MAYIGPLYPRLVVQGDRGSTDSIVLIIIAIITGLYKYEFTHSLMYCNKRALVNFNFKSTMPAQNGIQGYSCPLLVRHRSLMSLHPERSATRLHYSVG